MNSLIGVHIGYHIFSRKFEKIYPHFFNISSDSFYPLSLEYASELGFLKLHSHIPIQIAPPDLNLPLYYPCFF